MSSNVESNGAIRQLTKKAEPDENVTEAAVKDPKLLVRFILRLFRDVAILKRRWWPRRMDFRDIVSTGTDVAPVTVRLNHNLGVPVVWWPVRHTVAGTVVKPFITETTESDLNTLVLSIYYAATITIRVEESG